MEADTIRRMAREAWEADARTRFIPWNPVRLPDAVALRLVSAAPGKCQISESRPGVLCFLWTELAPKAVSGAAPATPPHHSGP